MKDQVESMIRVVRGQLAEGRTPEQIASSVRDLAEWYIELAWRMQYERDHAYDRDPQPFSRSAR